VPLLDQQVERPFGAAHDRKARRPEPEDWRTRQILQNLLRPPDRVTEGVTGLVRDPLVVVRVRRQLVPRRRDPLDHAGVPLGHPAHHEKGAGGAARRHRVEQLVRGPLDAALERPPAIPGSVRRECDNLEIFFDVDRENMCPRRNTRGDDGATRCRRRQRWVRRVLRQMVSRRDQRLALCTLLLRHGFCCRRHILDSLRFADSLHHPDWRVAISHGHPE
jgi:hypothetical protein